MSQASVRNVQPKQVIFYEGDTDRHLYKVISGRIAFYARYGMPGERLIGITAAPHYFGAMTALSGAPATYTAVAVENATVLQLPESELETLPKSDPAGAVTIMKNIAAGLETSREQMRSLLGELGDFCRGGGGDPGNLIALAEKYMKELNAGITDAHTPYVPAAPAPVAAAPVADEKASKPAPAPVPSPVREEVKKPEPAASAFPAPYPEDHRGYPGVTHPEYAKYLIPAEYTCPHCRKKFPGFRIQVSKLIPVRDESEAKRYDLRVTYNGFETEWHEVITCPHCCFSAFENYFRENKSLYQSRYESKLAELCKAVPVNLAAEKTLDTVFAQHYMALLCAAGFAESRQITARLWINLVRLYQDANEPQLAELAEKNALEAYEKVYMEVELAEGQEQRLCLTVAGILFARGEKLAAREWAARVRRGSNDRSAYWNMAEQLIQDVRAEMAENS